MGTTNYDAAIKLQLQTGKTNTAAGTNAQAALPKTRIENNSTLTNLENQQTEAALTERAIADRNLKNQQAVFNGNANADFANKLNPAQERNSSNDEWCNCPNCTA